MPGIFPFLRDLVDGSRKIRLLSDTHSYTPTRLESSTTSQLHLHLPEVLAPVQYLIDVGLQPVIARRLSSTYMDFVDRYRKTCQSHFDRVARGGHLTEYYREVFIILFKRTTQVWGSQLVLIVRIRLCQAGASQATVRPEHVDIRVDEAGKAEIIARLGLNPTHLTSDKMVMSPSADVTSRLEEVSEQTNTLSPDTVGSRLMLSGLSPISLTEEVTSRALDPFSQPAPPTCFPAPYPPPLEYSSSHSLQRALATSFVPPAPPRNVRPLASYSPDVSSLTNLFGRMTVSALKPDSINPKCHRMFGSSESNKIKPVPSPIAANCVESVPSPPESTTTVRRRKIATLPTRRGKTSASPSPPVFDSTGATSYPAPHPSERVVEWTPLDYVPTSPQKTRHVSTLPSLYTAEASCVATPKSSTAGQRKVHILHHKTLPQSQTIPQNHALTPLTTAGKTFSYTVSRSSPLVSDATSYSDSPPTSSDELDTPPSTPPRLHVLLARSSAEDLAISSQFDGIVSHKEQLSNARLPNPRQRYRRLDFTKGLSRDEQPLTFTFSV